MKEPKFWELVNRMDTRGSSFYLPPEVLAFLGEVHEMHFVTIEPDCVRGNHFHPRRRELMFVHFHSAWSLGWISPGNDVVQTKRYKGNGGVLVGVDAGMAHAIKNTGSGPLSVVSCSNEEMRPGDTERVIIFE